MKKYYIIYLILFSNLLYSINIDQIVSNYSKHGIELKLAKNFNILEPIEQYNAKYDFGFTVSSQEVEYRLSFVEDDFEDFRKSGMSNEEVINFLLVPIAANISQQFESPTLFRAFPKSAVKNEFNTEFGLTGLVEGNSMFSNGWKYVMIDGFYKKDCGFIIRYALFNDLSEITKNENQFYSAYHAFRFK